MQSGVIEGYRLSPQQRRLWMLQHNSSAFRVQCEAHLDGPLDNGALIECLKEIVGRHDALRTVFHRLPGMKTPVQVVNKNLDLDWQECDLTQETNQQDRVDLLVDYHNGKGFDLDNGPPLHALLIALSTLNHVLVLSLPALCGDFNTMTSLVQKLAKAYGRQGKGRADLGEEVRYIQYSEWLNRLAGEPSSEGAFSQSQDLITKAALKTPLEKRAPDHDVFMPTGARIVIDSVTAERLAATARSNQASIGELLLSCWMTLMWRQSHDPEIVIGNLWNGRGHDRLQDALGLFARWLPVRCRFEKDYDLKAILDQVKKASEDAHSFRERFIWPDADAAGNFTGFPSIGFECVEDAGAIAAGAVTMKIKRQAACADRFKMKLLCRIGETIAAELQFDEAAVSREEAELIAQRFNEIIQGAVSSIKVTVGKVGILGELERRRVLEEWNDTSKEYPKEKDVTDQFEEAARSEPDCIAVEYEGEQVSYEELNRRANQVARRLRDRGVGADIIVGIMLDRGVDMLVGLLGVMKSGGAYVPLDPHLPQKRVALMLEDCGRPLVITRKRLHSGIETAIPRAVYIDDDWEAIAQESGANLERACVPENLAYILFTSGSTGKPKGVAVEHRQLTNYVNTIRERLELPEKAGYATVSTFSADLGNTVIFPSLCAGGRLHVISQEWTVDASAIANYFERHSIDCLKIVPSHLTALLASSKPERVIPQKRLILGGEVSHWSLIDKIESLNQDCLIFNHYGPTETTVGVLTYPIRQAPRPAAAATVPIGKPISNTETYILDSYLNPVPIGVAGGLFLSGEGVARGYLNSPELAAERFIPNPFSPRRGARMYQTGDLGRRLSDGNIEFLGRADGQVKYHGYRIELAEIVSALNRHPKIRNSVVRIAPDKNGDDVLIAYYESRQEIELSELRAFLRDSIIEETLPRVFTHLRKLPLTPNGKVNYEMLPSLEEVRQKRPKEFVTPRNHIEERLVQICSDVLGLDSISVEDNFFELGGHSLLATRVISRISESLKIEIPVRSLFENSSLGALAEMIGAQLSERENNPEPTIRALRRSARSAEEQLAELNIISEDEARALLEA